MKKETVNKETGEISTHKLNEVITVVTKRPNGTIRIQHDYQYCPTMAEQHTAHLTDINYLMSKYKPDELAAYIAAKNQHRAEITGHDFSTEPSLQEARNITYQLKQNFEALPDEVKMHFSNHVEFLKFIDNPKNQEKMLKLGLMTPRDIKNTSTNNLNELTNKTNIPLSPTEPLSPNPGSKS